MFTLGVPGTKGSPMVHDTEYTFPGTVKSVGWEYDKK